MSTTAQEIGLMKQKMESMEEKLEKMDGKLDMITERLLDPDSGVAARVNRNTAHRKLMSKALWVIYAVVIGLVIKMIWE
jgi:tetrahydromethanopterin S-methyltransferase subunit G